MKEKSGETSEGHHCHQAKAGGRPQWVTGAWPRVEAGGGLEVTLICRFKGKLAEDSTWDKTVFQ